MIGIDMKMPKTCGECLIAMSLRGTDVFYCPAIRQETTYNGHDEDRHPGCPLCELPDDGEIRVGDEVTYDDETLPYVVTFIYQDNDVDAIRYDGRSVTLMGELVKPTGRHFDEVETLLQKIRGEDDA